MTRENNIYSRPHQAMGEKLRLARLEAKLTQYAVANLLDTSQSCVSKIELSQCHVDAITLASFAKLYKKDVEYFLS